MVTARESGSGYRWWSNDNTLRFYDGSTATFSVPDGYAITQIVTTGANFDDADKGELSSDTWTGLEREVKLSATGGRNIKTITVTYVPEEISVTVTASGYLSYCSPYKLDFSETNVKAYKASVDGEGKVTLTKLDVVPANEGVVLFSSEAKDAAEATDYSIPVTDKNASDITGNQMVGVLTRTQVLWNPSTGVYNYILQSGEFKNATDGYLKANRAYLSTAYNAKENGAKALTIVFDDGETTNINLNVNDNLNFDQNAPRYNMSGQRVSDSYKGIVIVNGKKYINK